MNGRVGHRGRLRLTNSNATAPWTVGNDLTVLLETESIYGRSLQFLELVMITMSEMYS